ncbi:MAG: hypothetical protein IPM24_11135 [Bryobacterales bacterium]|jgi:hypothetical protein|nr:hypothetical protein [Bryobacterales bacterium]
MRIVILILLVLLLPAVLAAGEERVAGKPASVQGCLDQEGPDYVLKDLMERQIIVILEPVGFPKQQFAKHVGTQVAVTGTWAEDLKTVRVRRYRQIAPTCKVEE